MEKQTLSPVDTVSLHVATRRVYCEDESPLKLRDGAPVHLSWVIEGTDGNLYTVLSELGGWFRRTPYRGQLTSMKLVSTEKAQNIMWLTYADTEDREAMEVKGYSGCAIASWAY